jgi:hypothetical protein
MDMVTLSISGYLSALSGACVSNGRVYIHCMNVPVFVSIIASIYMVLFGFACVHRASQVIYVFKNHDSLGVLEKLCFSSIPHYVEKQEKRQKCKVFGGIIAFAG